MSWESWTIRGHVLEYDDESHCYICDGLIVPSVTQILKRRFGGKYDGVPGHILREAARKGTLLHNAIEALEISIRKGEDAPEHSAEIADEMRSYDFLKRHYGFTVEGNEMPLLIPYKGKIVAAGRMDMLLVDKDGRIGIADIKRTAKLDESYLSYQLTLYARGMEYCHNTTPEFYRCIWLRGTERKYKEIRGCDKLVDDLLSEVAQDGNQS